MRWFRSTRWLIFFVVCVLLLTGCWDQKLLKNVFMVDIVGIDQRGKDDYHVEIVVSELKDAYQGGGNAESHRFEADAKDLFQSIEDAERKMRSTVSLANNRLYLINKEFAKNTPGDYLDFLGKVPNSPLLARIAIVEGGSHSILKLNKIMNETTPSYLVSMLNQAVSRDRAVAVKLWELIMSRQNLMEDLVVPLLAMNEDEVELTGSSLFSEGSYSGVDLNVSQTQELLLMKYNSTEQNLNVIVNSKNMRVKIIQATMEKNLVVSDGKLKSIKLPVKVEAEFYAYGVTFKPVTKQELLIYEQELSKALTENAEKTIKKLQQAKCDYFALGQYVYAHEPDIWMSMKWKDVYKEIEILPEFKVRLTNSGTYDYKSTNE